MPKKSKQAAVPTNARFEYRVWGKQAKARKIELGTLSLSPSAVIEADAEVPVEADTDVEVDASA